MLRHLRAGAIKLKDLVTEPPQGRLSLSKCWGSAGCLVMSWGFITDAMRRGLGWDDYIGYASGLAIMLSPALATKVIGLKLGGPIQQESTTVMTQTTISKDKEART